MIRTVDAESVKACCATFYGVDAVTLLLGESYHPGGATLTRRLADRLGLRPGERVLDVASGIGTSAVLLATEHDVDVRRRRPRQQPSRPSRRPRRERRPHRPRPLPDRRRRTPPRGRRQRSTPPSANAPSARSPTSPPPPPSSPASSVPAAVSVSPTCGSTPTASTPSSVDSPVASPASPTPDRSPTSRATLGRAGFTVAHLERHDQALADTIDQITTRLRALRIADLPFLRGVDLTRAIELARRAADTVRRGDAGYVLLVATKP